MYSPNHVRLVGRTREQDTLRVLLHRAKQAQGQVAYVIGEAGIGKTRLLAALTSYAETNDFAVIRGECLEQDRNFPYAPIIDGLRTHFADLTSEELQRIIGPFQPELVRLLPELARFEGERTFTSLEPEAEKHRLFEALMQIYLRLNITGLLLIFEDIHWSDTNSLEFFQTLTRRISKQPIVAVLSGRWTASDSEVARLRLYLDRAENAQTIVLNPLTGSEIENLTKIVLQTAEPIHPALLEKLDTLTQGNPLYAEQIVYMLLQNRQINLVNGTWMITSSTKIVEIPTSIKQTVEQQLARLTEPAQQVLRFAAVAGRQFDMNALQQLTGFDGALLIKVMKGLISQRFLDEVSRDRFAFRHALLRQAIYDSLLIRERQELHRAMLHILEAAETVQSSTHLAELSYHAYQSEVWEAALRYGFQAGQRALALHSPRSAVEHFSHAVEAAGRLGESASWELSMQHGRAYDSLGEFQNALNDYEAALRAAERSGDQAAEWQTLMALALLWSARDYQPAEDYCKRALQLAQAMNESRLIGHSLNRLGNCYLNTGQPSEALGYHEQALAVFDALDDLPGKGETLDLLGMTSSQMMRSEAAQDYYRAAIAIFRKLDDRKALASGLSNLASWTFDVPLAEEAVSVARQIGWYSGEAYACISLGYRLACLGRFTESLSYLQHGFELARAIDHTQWLANAYVYTALLYRDLLELTTAADHARKTVALAAEVGSQWFSDMGNGLLASILIEQGKFATAEEVLAHQLVPESPAMQHMMLIMAEAELALAHGQGEAALASSERLHNALAFADTSSGMGALITLFYFVEQARALLLSDRRSDALEVLEYARRVCTHWGFLPFLWRVEVLLGQSVEDDNSTAAQECFQRARDCIEQLIGYVPSDMRQRFRQRAEKIVAAAEKREEPTTSRNQLTRRELDVAREIALGKTNQQIADELHVTVKTVEAHVTRILSKLYLTSRTQIALWAVDNQLLPPSESD